MPPPQHGGGPGQTGGTFFLITCEHGGKRLPQAYAPLFAGREALLSSHRGYDAGALTLARELSDALHAPLVSATISRLLVDLNRSPGHRGRFSEITRPLGRRERAEIDAAYYLPYRRRVERIIAQAVERGSRVVHISSHSFTPVMDGRVRTADVGFLYDPHRPPEADLSRHWMAALAQRDAGLRLRRNYPYTGRADGFCAWLRRRYAPEVYVGLELEVNQRHVTAGGPAWRQLRGDIVAALLHAVDGRKAGLAAAGSAEPGPERKAGQSSKGATGVHRQAAPSSTA
ncbi:MAG TPA: N-formylglutamate amidohydrolase [Aromatoleum sp.]|uniref:N-formylglutamate amidohydrolase n=1 Tax=Aromatoleum sp. TaxID=2307007 RepID=UPI002B47C1A9|nr:N-formylglutamate amidohydrolase [Aromatoleum sp.]HJV24679.1 N-formylglutamate amidohydrolase [Aromatoleum sp.]